MIYPLLFMLGAYTVGEYVLRCLACRRDANRASLDLGTSSRRGKRRWCVLPLCVCLIVSLGLWNWPLHARFALSRTAFDHMRTKINAGANPPSGYIWIGLYRVQIHDIDGEILFSTGHALVDEYGFIHGKPTKCPVAVVERCAGNWLAVQYPP
ncbi:MAG: hypothetical protein H6818_02105 [Phycisphaerales bacterium]|nr:hypothetical protein [Phycisphaerales bacterium]